MAKKKSDKPLTKSDFLRKIFAKTPTIDYANANLKWIKAGHPGEISAALFYQVRNKMGIKIVWQWAYDPEAAAKNSAAKGSGPASLSRPVGTIHQLKITIKDTKPPIWRRIQVPDCTLGDLHYLIQAAFGWTDSHMHEFVVNGERYRHPSPIDFGFGDDEGLDERNVKLSELVAKSGSKPRWLYVYDFGDDWQHEILVENSPSAIPGVKYPVCVSGKHAGPPEDCGGPWGYAEMLDALADPTHERHDEFMEWAGPIDPDDFDATKATAKLRKVLP